MKLVKERLYEKFTEDSDSIHDMGIGVKKVYYRFYSRSSNYILLITGDTYALRDILKRHGFEWNPGDYGWKSQFNFPQDWWLTQAPIIFKEIENKPGYVVELKGKIKFITGLNASFSIPGWDNAQYPDIPDGKGLKLYFKQWHHHAPMIGVMGQGSYAARKVLAYEGYLFSKEQHRWEAVYDPDDTDELIEYLKSKNYTVIDGRNNKPVSTGKVLEKFKEDSDPVNDMGIGAQKWWKKEAFRIGQSSEEHILAQYYPDLPHRSPSWYAYILYEVIKDAGEGRSPQESFVQNCRANQFSNGTDEKVRRRVAEALKEFFEIEVNSNFSEEDLEMPLTEKFNDESDPIHDMGIGVSYQTLTKGAILGVKQKVSIGRKGGTIVAGHNGYVLRPGMFLLVARVLRMLNKMQSIQVITYNDIKYAYENKKDFTETTAEMYQYANRVSIRIPEDQFNKRFEIIEKGF